MKRATTGLLATLCVTAAVAGEVAPEGKGVEAVAIIFAAKYTGGVGLIEINSTADPPWSEARIISRTRGTFYIQARGDAECHYDITGSGTRYPDLRSASIAFGLLSGETEILHRSSWWTTMWR